MIAAQSTLRRFVQRRVFLQARASSFFAGCPGTARHRVLSPNPKKHSRSNPAENFESNAAARHAAKTHSLRLLGSRHRFANAHRVSSENSVTATSVSTSGPNVRKTGAVA